MQALRASGGAEKNLERLESSLGKRLRELEGDAELAAAAEAAFAAFAKDLVRIQPLVLVPEAAGAAAGALLWAALATAPEKRTALRAAPAALRVAAAAAHWVATKALGVRTLAPNAELMARAASVPKAALAAEERALLHTLKWEVAAVLRRAGVARSY